MTDQVRRHPLDRSIARRSLMLGGAAILLAGRGRAAFATPAAADFDRRLAFVTEQEKLSGLHALLVSQHGSVIFEHYQPGEDKSRSRGPLGRVVFGPDVPHDLYSVSKGVVALLYGIALAEGKVPPPEAGLYAQFPEYADLALQPGREKLTIAHVLSMTMGLAWDELSIPYGHPQNSEDAMDAAPDRYRYILSLPIVYAPGSQWTYCGGATALLAHLIVRATGQPLLDYARRVLFEPMGFGASAWATDSRGEPYAASGLRLLPRDMLKIGQLVLSGGEWQGRQLVPAGWVKTITTPVVRIDARRDYGYHWYVGQVTAAGQSLLHRWVGGIGWGGQFLFVLPDLDLVVAMNCGNYGMTGREQGRVAFTILMAVVLPLLS
ncbi:CubicO group peptidase, beta-lactamase class C family [Enhydrobacter aerosaccus]|uniref:CubicO group peptidase, beta-lactamase class C family n=1 Tax=Enhydrobacter aerosaccus TaxID=225324 RepID=A0A1T4QH83_9HYPH|nr:serine hydrolase domain-containing protein [Enhydrobacter aerosaccus]SKA02996.1 CubicO group peptidase, beta-lactamase class C family [Enhydrobacter aerosaccus]